MENPSGRPDKFRSKRGPEKGERRKLAEDAGLSRHQMYQAMQVASIPEDEFERLVESQEPLGIAELARIGRGEQSKPRPSPRDAATKAIAKAMRAAHAAYWAACDSECRAIDPADLGADEGLLADAYEAALIVEGIAAERGLSWHDARDYV